MQVVLASSNAGKLKELQELLSPLEWQVISQGELGIEGADETGLTFVENALLKARHAAQASGLPSLADDSGLVVPALQGAPGIHSARYAGSHGDDSANNNKLLNELQNNRKRDAYFFCAMVFMAHADDPTPLITTARWHGKILEAPQGAQGFGYDPLFWVEAHQRTSAQLDPQLKNSISHRGQATRQLVDQLTSHS